jgi:hypothetical protein
VQTPELYDDQEQANYPGQAGVQEILQVLSNAHFAQGNQVIGFIEFIGFVGFIEPALALQLVVRC